MNRASILIILLAIILNGCKDNNLNEPPNIILFLVDDLGWQDTSVPFWKEKTPFNNLYRTPNMERLASEGVKCTQAYACSVCSPTRVSLLTGMNAARHRVTNWTLRKDKNSVADDTILAQPEWNLNGLSPVAGIDRTIHATTLPQILNDNGYFTIHAGKAHFGAIGTPGSDPINLGYDVNIAGHAAGAPGSYQGTNDFSAKYRGAKEDVWDVPGLEKYHKQDINLTDVLTIESKAAIDSALIEEKPFFLYMAHYTVHTPLEADRRYIKGYDTLDLPKQEKEYASMIEGMDRSLGDLMDYLEEKNLSGNTIILFMSDNGGLSAVARGREKHSHNLPLSSGKGSAHEGGIREPMMVKWPGKVQPGSVHNDYLIIEDFFPTILEMAQVNEVKTIQEIDGKNFVHELIHPSLEQKSERSLFWHYPNRWGPTGPGIGSTSTIRKGKFKLIFYHADRSFELFDLANDIGEKKNLADSQPEKLKEMAIKLSDYLKDVDAQMPIDKSTGQVVEYPDEVIN